MGNSLPTVTPNTAPSSPKHSVSPASDRAMAVAVAAIVKFATTFGIEVPNPKSLTEIFRDTLGDLPDDLLLAGVKRCLTGWKWTTLPKPADIRETVEADLRDRRDLTRLLESKPAKAIAQPERPPSPTISAEQFEAVMAEARRARAARRAQFA